MSLFVVCRAAAQIFSGSHSIQTIRDQLLHQPPTISNTFLLSQLIPPDVGFSPWLQLPNIQMQVWSYLLSSPFYFFSFILLIYGWICVILSIGQRLLLVFSQFSMRTIASVDIFLIHLWREIHSFSIYSSTILAPLFLKFSMYLPFDLEDRSTKH